MVVSCNNHHIPCGYLAHHILHKTAPLGRFLLFLSLRYTFGIPSVKVLSDNGVVTEKSNYCKGIARVLGIAPNQSHQLYT